MSNAVFIVPNPEPRKSTFPRGRCSFEGSDPTKWSLRHVALAIAQAEYARYFLNEGIPAEAIATVLRILPAIGTLRQGTFNVEDQFVYRYNANTDERIVAAAVSFHSGLHVVTFALADEKLAPLIDELTFFRCSPGELFS